MKSPLSDPGHQRLGEGGRRVRTLESSPYRVLKQANRAAGMDLSTEFRGPDIERVLHIRRPSGTQLIGSTASEKSGIYAAGIFPTSATICDATRGGRRRAGAPRDVDREAFRQMRVVGGDQSGHHRRLSRTLWRLHRSSRSHPGVTFVPTRPQLLAREKERFDIVELTFIDTCATAAGLTSRKPSYVEGWKSS